MKRILLFTASLLVAAQLNAQVPRPEYPRPQFERANWVNLNGQWSYTFDFGGSGLERNYAASKGFDGNITVPFCLESELSGVGYTDFINNVWYHRRINIPAAWDGKRVMLNFGAVYYTSEIYVDGKFAGRHFGGSSSFSLDITHLVSAGSSHDLVVLASSDLRSATQGAGKQSLQFASYGCNYTRTTGIWQTVWMEAVDRLSLKTARTVTDIDQNQLVVFPEFNSESNGKLKITVKDNGRTVAQTTVNASNNSVAVLPIKNAKLWSPESPFLYDVVYEVTDASGKVTDAVNSYVGMRKVHIEGNKIYLNNSPYYQRLVLDQGFYPDGIWTAPSDEALRRDIELSMSVGFNGARLHQKVFEERFYYWADKLGYLTWGEAPSWGMDANSIETARNFMSEWTELVVRDRNHPSLVIWTPMNEEWWPDKVQYPRFVADIYDLTKSLDPTRPCHDVSGGVHIKTDIWTMHSYEQDPAKLRDVIYDGKKFFTTPNWANPGAMNIGFNGLRDNDVYDFPDYDGQMPFLIDEFGGIKWVKDQDKQLAGNSDTQSWGYGEAPRSIEELLTRLEGQVDAILSLSDHVWGYCYTQLTDVEQEQNGVFYYDRTSKFDTDKLRSIFGKDPQ